MTILIIVNIGVSVISPVILSTAYLIKHIKSSSCWGVNIETYEGHTEDNNILTRVKSFIKK